MECILHTYIHIYVYICSLASQGDYGRFDILNLESRHVKYYIYKLDKWSTIIGMFAQFIIQSPVVFDNISDC